MGFNRCFAWVCLCLCSGALLLGQDFTADFKTTDETQPSYWSGSTYDTGVVESATHWSRVAVTVVPNWSISVTNNTGAGKNYRVTWEVLNQVPGIISFGMRAGDDASVFVADGGTGAAQDTVEFGALYGGNGLATNSSFDLTIVYRYTVENLTDSRIVAVGELEGRLIGGHSTGASYAQGSFSGSLSASVTDDGQAVNEIPYDFSVTNASQDPVTFYIMEDVDGTPTQVKAITAGAGGSNHAGSVFVGNGVLSIQGGTVVSGDATVNPVGFTGTWTAGINVGDPPVSYDVRISVAVMDTSDDVNLSVFDSASALQGVIPITSGNYTRHIDAVIVTGNAGPLGFAVDDSNYKVEIVEGGALVEGEVNNYVIAILPTSETLSVDSQTVGTTIDQNGDTNQSFYYELNTGTSSVTFSTSDGGFTGTAMSQGSTYDHLQTIDAETGQKISGVAEPTEEGPPADIDIVFGNADGFGSNGQFAALPVPTDYYTGLGQDTNWDISLGTYFGIEFPVISLPLDSPFVAIARAVLLVGITITYLVWAYKIAKI